MIFNENKIYIAFYKGDVKLLDKIIKWTARGFYSHVELILNGVSYSSSGRDGGVRKKDVNNMHFDDRDKWDIFEIDYTKANDTDITEGSLKAKISTVFRFLFKNIPAEKNTTRDHLKYDHKSIFLYHLLRLNVPKIDKNKYICTEFVLDILKFLLNINEEYMRFDKKVYKKAFEQGYKMTPTNVLEVLSSLNLLKLKED